MIASLRQRLPDCTGIDRGLQLWTVLLIAVGCIAMTSASVEHAAQVSGGNPFAYFQRYSMHLGLALLLAILVYQVPMRMWQDSGPICLLVCFVLLALVLVPGVGHEVNGSRRWMRFGPLTLQVSELVKLAVVIYMAGYLVRRQHEISEQFSGFLKPMLVLFLVTLLLMMEPDFGATAVTVGTAFVMLFIGGARLAQFSLVLLASVAGLAAMILISPYRMRRLTAFADPWADQFDTGYQLTQALIAFGRGEWFGVGLGNSIQKLFYLPEAHTDFVFAIWAEEFGFVGAVIAIAMFAALIWRIFQIGSAAADEGRLFSAHVAFGIGIIFSAQVFINIGVNSGLLPTKGLTLPFWSYGGSSLLVSLVMLAVVARVHRESVQGVDNG